MSGNARVKGVYRSIRLFVSMCALALILLVLSTPAAAGSGLRYWDWGSSGYTVSSGSYKYSNMSGFYQAVINANGCPVAVDGIYGSNTTWHAAVLQNEVLGYNNGGVMTPWYAHQVQYSQSVYGYRLVYEGYTDGYGTRHYGYYAGQTDAQHTRLGWNPISSQWLFSQFPQTNPGALVPAATSRTIGSVAACS